MKWPHPVLENRQELARIITLMKLRPRSRQDDDEHVRMIWEDGWRAACDRIDLLLRATSEAKQENLVEQIESVEERVRTRDFRDTVAARAKRDPVFKRLLDDPPEEKS